MFAEIPDELETAVEYKGNSVGAHLLLVSEGIGDLRGF